MIRALGKNSEQFAINVAGGTLWGDVKLEFSFELGWGNGKIHAICSTEHLDQLKKFIRERATVGHTYDFLNSDGNLELKIFILPTGMCRFEVIAMPDMIGDDRIEFSFDGIIHVIEEGRDEWHVQE